MKNNFYNILILRINKLKIIKFSFDIIPLPLRVRVFLIKGSVNH